MPLDSICVSGLAAELDAALAGARIDKIHMPAKDKIILHLRGVAGVSRLLLSGGSDARVHLTAMRPENPDSPPMLCMLLRKHLANGRVLSVRQPGQERAIQITISSAGELGDITEKRLICEMTGRMTNVILAGPDDIIMACLKNVDQEASARPVLPGLKYLPPPGQGKPSVYDMPPDQLEALCAAAPPEDFYGFLSARLSGLSPLMLRECVYLAKGDCHALAGLLGDVKSISPRPHMLVRQGAYFDFAGLPIAQYPDCECTPWPGFSALLDDFYRERETRQLNKNAAGSLVKTMTNIKGRLTRKLAGQQQELESARRREDLKNTADLITANLHAIRPGDKSAVVTDYFSPDLRQVEIRLDEALSPQQNAQRLYKKYARQKNAEAMLSQQIERGQAELEYVENALYSLSAASGPKEIDEIRRQLAEAGYVRQRDKSNRRAKPAAFAPRRFLVDGFTILCGRSNGENDTLTHRHAAKNDIWLHARNIPGAHVIIEAEGRPVPDHVVEAAAAIAAYYSAAQGRIAVDYTLARHVKKPQGARPGMVNYFSFKTAVVQAALPPQEADSGTKEAP